MSKDFIRQKFIELFGTERYMQFVLSLYEAFPIRDKLLFWQEQQLSELASGLDRQKIRFEEAYSIFNHCPLHDTELKEDNVAIVDGLRLKINVPFEIQKELFPLANTEATRNLEMWDYPKSVKVLYCSECRSQRMEFINKQH